MDKWSALSINHLFDTDIVTLIAFNVNKYDERQKRIIKTRRDFHVRDDNGKDVYQNFCRSIELLALKLKTTPDLAEERLFSEGRNRGAWRKHVRKFFDMNWKSIR